MEGHVRKDVELVQKHWNTALIFDTAPNYGQGTSELRLGKAEEH
jgi:aryl-alcohol dehydrogenase-like predicted oxidoreductase